MRHGKLRQEKQVTRKGEAGKTGEARKGQAGETGETRKGEAGETGETRIGEAGKTGEAETGETEIREQIIDQLLTIVSP